MHTVSSTCSQIFRGVFGFGNGINNRCNKMGYWAKPLHGQNESVNYFLDTAKESPFAMHDYQIQIRLGMVPGESQNEIKAKLAVKLYGEYDHSDEIILTQ